MPDKSRDIDFISIDDLMIQDKAAVKPEAVLSQNPDAVATLAAAGKRRRTIVQRRRKRGGSESVLAASMGAFLIVLAVGVYHSFSPTPPSPVRMPVVQAPRVFKVPPQPAPAKAAEPLPTTSPQVLKKDDIPPRIDETKAAPPQAIDLQASVTDFLSAWGRAWEKTAGPEGALGPYLDCYATAFTHEGMDKAAWAADKGRKNRRKDWIRVRLSDIRVATPVAGEPVRVTFFQDYASSNYSVAAEKALLLKNSGSSWQIIGIR